mmetsp:Transcript_93318/g.216964  ORF Transcript_93318/g.216964 Transcript_93318/m.216964 type:complete len:438 (+) Transcript_93318:52-1365(+)
MAALARIVLMLPLASMRVHAVRSEELQQLALHRELDLAPVSAISCVGLRLRSYLSKGENFDIAEMLPAESEAAVAAKIAHAGVDIINVMSNMDYECSVMQTLALANVSSVSNCVATCEWEDKPMMVTAPLFKGSTFRHMISLSDKSATRRAMEGTLLTGFTMLAHGCALRGKDAAKSIHYQEDGSLQFTDFSSVVNFSSDLTSMNHSSDWIDWISLEPGESSRATARNVIAYFLGLLFDKVSPDALTAEEISVIWKEAWGQQTSTQLFKEANVNYLKKLKFEKVPLYKLARKGDVGRVQDRLDTSSFEDKERALEYLLWLRPFQRPSFRLDENAEEIFGILLSSLEKESKSIAKRSSAQVYKALESYLDEEPSPLGQSAGRMLDTMVSFETRNDLSCSSGLKELGSNKIAMRRLNFSAPVICGKINEIYKLRNCSGG